jgi:biopolymer transport protein ExbD
VPVKLGSKLPADHAEPRIEIVPLIDIMFFLLAAFMLVSLSMVNLKSVPLNLPAAAGAATESRKDIVDVSVDKAGGVFVDKVPVGRSELAGRLAATRRARPDVRVVVSGDREARHGDVVAVLDAVRAAGIDRVGVEVRPPGKVGTP